jgi:hypothetical protein
MLTLVVHPDPIGTSTRIRWVTVQEAKLYVNVGQNLKTRSGIVRIPPDNTAHRFNAVTLYTTLHKRAVSLTHIRNLAVAKPEVLKWGLKERVREGCTLPLGARGTFDF